MQLIPVNSSNVAKIGYDNTTLEVHFHSGSVYHYHNVSKALFNEFLLAKSKGKFLNSRIKPVYLATQIR